ncbi:MAG TPA: dNTP triphosphohydrolase, partial [Halothiobacillaceae bacterium]|nr:dNTP triphosphohydrolase [Halothiobacillaceae bacterium]
WQIANAQPRTAFERDYDRVLFSSPVRRMADKTQVFPLERGDTARTRLTHSFEVSNLARSVGIDLSFNRKMAAECANACRDIPAILATIGLAHDLGNPPFGHQGEMAIARWFSQNEQILDDEQLSPAMRNDFLHFEGNAQTLRLLTKLQLINDSFGLNLTVASLAALIKYPTASDQIDKNHVARKKHGFFQSERDIVESIWPQVGLAAGQRHPLTWLMEACDDIAYTVLDAEDAVKKGLLSFSDTLAFLEHEAGDDPVTQAVCQAAREEHQAYRREPLSPSELNDISMQTFRIRAIGSLMSVVANTFCKRFDDIVNDRLKQSLLDCSPGCSLLNALKKSNRQHAYQHRSVLRVELTGFEVIHGLMDAFWYAITHRQDPADPQSNRTTPLAGYIYKRISENYRRVFTSPDNPMPLRYRELQLVTDMISGMTDRYALQLHEEFIQAGFKPQTHI